MSVLGLISPHAVLPFAETASGAALRIFWDEISLGNYAGDVKMKLVGV
jgi:hypothetical protein